MMSVSAVNVEYGRLALLLAAAACLAALASSARADAGDRFELRWRAPAGCPLERDVQTRIRSLLGASKASDARVMVEATVTRIRSARLHLVLIVHSEGVSGERELDGGSCDDLAGATAVNVVLLLQSFEPPAVAAPAAESVTVYREPSRTVAAESGRHWRLLVEVPVLGASLGLLPGLDAGAGLRAGLELRPWMFLIGAQLWLPRTLPALDAASAGAVVGRVEAVALACHTLLSNRVELAPCAEVSLQHISARGSGPHVMSETANAAWMAVGVALQARVKLLERLALTAYVEGSWHPARPTLVIDGLGKLQLLGAASASFAVGSEWIL